MSAREEQVNLLVRCNRKLKCRINARAWRCKPRVTLFMPQNWRNGFYESKL